MPRLIAAISVLAMIVACDGGRVRPPIVNVTVVNAAPTFPDIGFLRSQRREATLAYLSGTRLPFDADTYTYALRVAAAAATGEQTIDTFTHTLEADNAYVYVLIEAQGAIDQLIFNQAVFPANSTNTEFSVIHAAESAGAVDVYVEAPGTDLSTVSSRGTLAFRERQAPVTVAPGNYVVTLTQPGSPTNIVFTSPTLALAVAQSHALVIGPGSGTSALTLVAAGETVTTVADVNAGAALRVINGAGDRGARDLFANDNFSSPLVAATAFGTASAFATVAAGQTKLTITPTGNPSAIEREVTEPLASGSLYNVLIAGTSGDLEGLVVIDARRATRDEARVQFFNLVNAYAGIDVFFVPVGTDITTVLPTFQIGSPGASFRTAFPLGERALTIRDSATRTIIFGPQTLALPEAGIYTVVSIDNADGTTADIRLLDDFE